jgi:hypothetical protein
MTQNQYIINRKLSILDLGNTLGNIIIIGVLKHIFYGPLLYKYLTETIIPRKIKIDAALVTTGDSLETP